MASFQADMESRPQAAISNLVSMFGGLSGGPCLVGFVVLICIVGGSVGVH